MINNIQVLRAFAAINVLVLHTIGSASSFNQSVFFSNILSKWGNNGVDIFFVISGFLAIYIQYNNKKNSKQIIVSKIARIVPLYWLINFTVISLFLFYPNLFRELIITPLWALSSLFFTSQFLFESRPIVYLGWALEWEMLFVIIFSTIIIFKNEKIVYLLTTTSIILVSVILNNFILLEFLFGMIVALIYQKKIISTKNALYLLLIGIFFLLLSLNQDIVKINRVIIWGLPSAVILLASINLNQLKNKTLIFIGNASYSIYLIQVLTIPGFYKFSSIYLINFNYEILFFISIFLSLIFGVIVYNFIEKPITSLIKKNYRH